MAASKKQPPAIIAEELGPWGEVNESDLATEARNDPWYTEGYSDKRREHELAMRAWKLGRGPKPDPLPYRFQYVRTTLQSGAPDNTKVAEFQAKGYRAIKFDEAASFGIDVAKSGFVRGVDGTCRVANQMLMVAPARIAAVHAKRQADLTKELSDGAGSKLQQAVDDFNARVGHHYGRAETFSEEELVKD